MPASAQSPQLPQGPLEILADHISYDGNVQVLTGNVRISSQTLKLNGAKVELEQYGDGLFKATVTGSPAHVEHAGGTGSDGRAVPPMDADADTLVYDARAGTIGLSGDVELTRGSDTLTGGNMEYVLATRGLKAERTDDKPIRLVIQAPGDLAKEIQERASDGAASDSKP